MPGPNKPKGPGDGGGGGGGHPAVKQNERSPSENKERAYIAASRRSDRSLEARVQSAKMASKIHKERTGKSLKISEEIVSREEMYEEEDDVPSHYGYGAPMTFPSRFQAFASLQSGLQQAATPDDAHRRIHDEFAQAFPNLSGVQMTRPHMPFTAAAATTINTAVPDSQPVSPTTATINPVSPALSNRNFIFAPAHLRLNTHSPVAASNPSPLVTPSAESPSSAGFFGAHVVASSPIGSGHVGFPAVSPSAMSTPMQRSMSLQVPTFYDSVPMDRGAGTESTAFRHSKYLPPDFGRNMGGSFDAPVAESIEPPAKRRRSQPHLQHLETMLKAKNDRSFSPRYAGQDSSPNMFTQKPPGSLRTLLRRRQNSTEKAAMSSELGSHQQTPALQRPPLPRSRHSRANGSRRSSLERDGQVFDLQSPPPPRSRESSASQPDHRFTAPSSMLPFESLSVTSEQVEIPEHRSDHETPGPMSDSHLADTGFMFDTSPASKFFADQCSNLGTDDEWARMLAEPLDGGHDDLWDMINMPPSQEENM